MKFLIVDPYYKAFLHSFYTLNPNAAHLLYAEHWKLLMDQCFGTADYYSTNLRRLGHEATEIVANCRPLQFQWAQENGLRPRNEFRRPIRRGLSLPWLTRDWTYQILMAQVKTYRPDVIYFQHPGGTDPAFLAEIRPYVRLIVMQIASPLMRWAKLRHYDLALSSFPHFVQRFRQQGLRSDYFRLGFEPKILQTLKRRKTHDVVFVGGLSRSHTERIKFFEQLARRQRLDWWGYGEGNLKNDSPLRAGYHGPAWALDMYETLYNARISLNHHINVAGNCANNMRLYEATGVGSLLVTDFKDNLHHLFEPGKEVVVYRTAEECAELSQYYLDHGEEREAIARAGQARTLREHTFYHRMQELMEMVSRCF
jgi:hypothetical protein